MLLITTVVLFICIWPLGSQDDVTQKTQCVRETGIMGCGTGLNDAELQYCCQWFNGDLKASPDDVSAAMKNINDTLIADVVFVVLDWTLVLCAIACACVLANDDEPDIEAAGYILSGITGVSVVCGIVRLVTVFNIVGVISQNDLVSTFEKLDEANCYASDPDMEWFATKLSHLEALAITLGIFKIIHVCCQCAFCVSVTQQMNESDSDRNKRYNKRMKKKSTLGGMWNAQISEWSDMSKTVTDHIMDVLKKQGMVKYCDFAFILVVSIGFWAVGFEVVNSWNDVSGSGASVQCYTGGEIPIAAPTFVYIEPTTEPTLMPVSPSQAPSQPPSQPQSQSPSQDPYTAEPTLETLSPSESPTMEPTLETLSPSQSPTMEPVGIASYDEDKTSESGWQQFGHLLANNWEVTLVVCVVVFVLLLCCLFIGCRCGKAHAGYEKTSAKDEDDEDDAKGTKAEGKGNKASKTGK